MFVARWGVVASMRIYARMFVPLGCVGLLSVAIAGAGCYRGQGEGAEEADGGDGGDEGEPPPEDGIGEMGLRRLSRYEYDNTVRDILFDDTRPGTQFLPEDVVDPFDNDFTSQQPSKVLIDGLESAAIDVSTRLIEDPERLSMVVGCTPSGHDDWSCMRAFIEDFGRRALRRPLTEDESERFLELAQTYANQKMDFNEGVDVAVRAFLQHGEFVYRVETGTPTEQDGVFRLDDFQVGARLSYFIWGSTPDDWLLDRAEAGELSTPEDVRDAAEQMLEDPRARERVDRFHAMWMGYFQLPHDPSLVASMRAETRALVEKVVFDDEAPWTELFTATGTFVDAELAALYGLPVPAGPDPEWTEYPDDRRMGLLSHGSFLSVAGKFGDTSPTQRGKLIRTRLMCQAIPPPPPDVNVDEPPQSEDSDCKWDRYAAHRELGASCKACHDLMDPVGFGLENFDQTGAWRDHDNDLPECAIAGEGTVDGMDFAGAAGLAGLLVDGEVLQDCAVHQLYRMAMGHDVAIHDLRYVSDLNERFRDAEYHFDSLVLDLVSDEAFMFRREEQ